MTPLLPPPHQPEGPGRSVSHVSIPSHLRGPMRSLYIVAGAMATIPFFQIAPRLLPLEPLASIWRYAAYSAIAGVVLVPAGALVLAHWVAAVRNDRPKQAAFAFASLGAGAALLLAAPLFLYDYVVLREDAAWSMRGAIDSAAWRALFAGVVAGAMLMTVGYTGWRSAWTPAPGQIRKKSGNGGLVVAQTRGDSPLEPVLRAREETNTD